MIIGLFLRHYKIYKGLNFIPLNAQSPDTFSLLIGNNGVGKSSVLEALDTFFNSRPFNVSLDSKRSEAFVAPLFLIEKSKIDSLGFNQEYCQTISDTLWNVTLNSSPNFRFINDFFIYRDNNLSNLRNTHFLLTLSKECESNSSYYFTFNSLMVSNLTNNNLNNKKEHSNMLTALKLFYKYIYIPIETPIDEFLKIETKGMQSLVDKRISDEIDEMLNEKRITRKIKNKKQTLSLLNIINEKLNKYINSTEEIIKDIDPSYSFKMQLNQRQNLTSNDIKDQIIYSYLSKRTLKKDGKPIKVLSDGERKKALIDIAYSFIIGSTQRNYTVILAIDEPESSLHISNCYEQFKRIQEISTSNNCQVLISTHWYGSLPLVEKGTILHVSHNANQSPKVQGLVSRYYFEDRKNHPDDIQMKSYFDLISSIISSIKLFGTNWLIVEGSEDLHYLEKMLNVQNLRILPVGGCGNVKVLFDFLNGPMSYKSEESSLNGKVFCLIDTDENGPVLETKSDIQNRKLAFRRLQIIGGKAQLVKNEDQRRSVVTIEQCLDPTCFFNSINDVAIDLLDSEILGLLSQVSLNADATVSQIMGDNTMLEYIGSSSDFNKIKAKLNAFILDNKALIAKNYVDSMSHEKLEFVVEIEKFFNT